jgi:hypothetical protein
MWKDEGAYLMKLLFVIMIMIVMVFIVMVRVGTDTSFHVPYQYKQHRFQFNTPRYPIPPEQAERYTGPACKNCGS